MKVVRILAFTALLVTGMILATQESAASGFGFSVGYSSFYPGYYPYRPYFYRPYYGGFYPNHFGYGFGYAYPYSHYGGYSYLGRIRTEVEPNEAGVFVDGDFAGEVDDFDGWWQRLEVEPGRHRLTFRAPGFAPYVIDVGLAPGQNIHIEYDMVRGQDQIAELEMRLPREEYSRRPEGRYRGYPPGPYRRSEPRPYDDRDRQYDEPYDRDQEYDRDQQYDRDDQYEQDRGSGPPPNGSNRVNVILNVEPPDASVYIDGNYYGTAIDNGRGEIQVLLSEGVHRVEVVRPGHASASQDVNVSRNTDNRVTITLLKK